MAICSGNSAGHCCYVAGAECRYLERGTVEGRTFACGLRRELGAWDRVHADERYLKHVRPYWDAVSHDYPDCGDWPLPGERCNECGVVG